MSAKEISNMSIAIKGDMKSKLEHHAKAAGMNSSELVRSLIETHLLNTKKVTIINHDPDHESLIVLKIPASLKGDKEAIVNWMGIKTAAIAEKLGTVPKPKVDEDR